MASKSSSDTVAEHTETLGQAQVDQFENTNSNTRVAAISLCSVDPTKPISNPVYAMVRQCDAI